MRSSPDNARNSVGCRSSRRFKCARMPSPRRMAWEATDNRARSHPSSPIRHNAMVCGVQRPVLVMAAPPAGNVFRIAAKQRRSSQTLRHAPAVCGNLSMHSLVTPTRAS